jgi:hypothetical protein
MFAAYLIIWASYSFRFSSSVNPEKDARVAAARARIPVEEALQRFAHPPIRSVLRDTAARGYLLKRFPDGSIPFDAFQETLGTVPLRTSGRLILFAQEHRLLPESFLFGFAYAERTSLIRRSYLMGQYSRVGFRSYFLWSFAFKTPLVTLVAILAGVFVAVCVRRDPWRSNLAFVLIPVIVCFGVGVLSHLNIGHRHMLPVYPFLFLLSGGLALQWEKWKGRGRKLVAVLALLAIVVGTQIVLWPPWRPIVIYPHYLAYFNELAGGPRNGYKLLVDSNLDWGQGLKSLRQWLDERGVTEPINLCYFGTADPRYYGIAFVNMPNGYGRFAEVERFVRDRDSNALSITNVRAPGFLAISATTGSGVRLDRTSRRLWKEFLWTNARLVDTVGHSIFIYYIEKPAD